MSTGTRLGPPARTQPPSGRQNPTRMQGSPPVGPARAGQYGSEPRQSVRSGRRKLAAGGAVKSWGRDDSRPKGQTRNSYFLGRNPYTWKGSLPKFRRTAGRGVRFVCLISVASSSIAFKTDLVMIALVFGSALLVVRSKKPDRFGILEHSLASCSFRKIFDFSKSARIVWSDVVCIYSNSVRSCLV